MTATLHAGELWWKNAVLYCLDVETYMDGDGDGVGDFRGLTSRLGHLASLGITCVWLLPFFPSSGDDDGYAVTDFYGIDPRFGTLGDFVTFRRAAGDHGIRVVIDMVVNHTSDQHPWFQRSRAHPESPWRDWYVWADAPIEAAEAEVFPGEQDGNWALDEPTGQYYFHRFHPFQPDLNLTNDEVRREIQRIMGFWLELGVDGFRLDAVPFLAETHGVHGPAGEVHHEWLREMHAFTTHRRGDAVLIGEANIDPAEMRAYFGDGDEMQLLFNFSQNAALIAALAEESAEPLRRHIEGLPRVPLSCGWLNFVRLHDELSLERLDDAERDRVFARFAPDPDTRIYGRGIRRRMAPLLADRAQLELAYSLAFSTPGMPMLLYGDEIAMGDNLSLPGRLGVRTPMQWERVESGGFSTAPPGQLVRPMADDGYGPADVDVATQRRQPDSFLAWTQRLIDVRRRLPTIGLGAGALLDTGHRDVFGHCCTWRGDTVVAVHNLSPEPRKVDLDVLGIDGPFTLAFADSPAEDRDEGDGIVELAGFGYRWLHCAPAVG